MDTKPPKPPLPIGYMDFHLITILWATHHFKWQLDGSAVFALSGGLQNQATGYASQHICCLSQTRINWEVRARKGIQHKNGNGRDGGTMGGLDTSLIWYLGLT